MNLIGDENYRDEEGTDIIQSDEEFSRKMAEEVFEESNDDSGVDLDLYQIETEELEEAEHDVDVEL